MGNWADDLALALAGAISRKEFLRATGAATGCGLAGCCPTSGGFTCCPDSSVQGGFSCQGRPEGYCP
jgi:hypothetical protein